MKHLTIFAAFILIAIMAGTTAQAQIRCIISGGKKCIINLDLVEEPIDTNCNGGSNLGSALFNAPVGLPSGTINASLTPTNVSVTITDPVLGTITSTLYAGPTNAATVTSNTQNRFPATVRFSFFSDATASARPGITFRTRTPIVFSSTTVNSYNPFVAETLKVENDVHYYDINDPLKKSQFILMKGSEVTLN